ncbi:MAG: hypothetical protein ACR2LM_06435 [Pyrinomonadaceae bacterium]
MKKLLLLIIILLVAASVAAADTIYLRDGRTVSGTLIGFVDEQFVVRVTSIGTNSGVTERSETGELRYFRPTEVDRIEIDGRSLDEARYVTRTVQVPLESNWIDSGVDVRRGERIQMRASGVIVAGRTRIPPDGIRSNDPSAPLPGAAEGKLIAAIGNESTSPVLEIGSTREFLADRDGRLYLTANRSSYADARGSFTVEIRREVDLRASSDDNIFNRRRRPGVRSRRPQTGSTVVRASEVTVEVSGTTRVDGGVDTGIDVRSGDQITITATGRVIAGRRIGEVGPEGGRSSGFGSIIGTRPVPTVGAGALIGYLRLTDGQVTPAFLIGGNLLLNPTQEGRLFLAINDDDYSDNGGSFTVRIRQQ